MLKELLNKLYRDAIKYHTNISLYSQAFINCVERSSLQEDNWLCIGDVDLEFRKLKGLETSSDRKPQIKWLDLSCWPKLHLKTTDGT